MYPEFRNLVVMELADPESFQQLVEPQLCSGTYLWVNSNTIVYNRGNANIFDQVDFDYIASVTPFELRCE